MFTSVSISDEVIDLKLGEKSAIFLTRKGELYQIGVLYRENGEEWVTENPRKLEKMINIKQIFSGMSCFFAIS